MLQRCARGKINVSGWTGRKSNYKLRPGSLPSQLREFASMWSERGVRTCKVNDTSRLQGGGEGAVPTLGATVITSCPTHTQTRPPTHTHGRPHTEHSGLQGGCVTSSAQQTAENTIKSNELIWLGFNPGGVPQEPRHPAGHLVRQDRHPDGLHHRPLRHGREADQEQIGGMRDKALRRRAPGLAAHSRNQQAARLQVQWALAPRRMITVSLCISQHLPCLRPHICTCPHQCNRDLRQCCPRNPGLRQQFYII